MFRKIILSIIGVLLVEMLSAQIGCRHSVAPLLAPDSLDLCIMARNIWNRVLQQLWV